MDLARLIPLVMQGSIMLTVVALGLEATFADVLALLRRPGQLLRSLLAISVIMPVVAVALARCFALHPAVQIALVALALSPVPPALPKKQLKAGGSSNYVYGLLVSAGLLAIVLVPLSLEVIEPIFGVSLDVSPLSLARIILQGILLPLAAGMTLRGFAPGFAGRVAQPLGWVAKGLLASTVLAVVVTAWPAMVSLIGNGTLAAFAAFIVAGLVTGHLLGGPDPEDRTTLAIASMSRHPGVALTIASANFPNQKLVLPAVLLFLIVGGILSVPYMKWRQSR